MMISIQYWLNFYLSQLKLASLLLSHNRLHVGCGTRIVENWINVDSLINPNLTHAEKEKIIKKPNFIICDVTKKWPFPPNSLSFIYASHFIEHVSNTNAQFFLKNCYRSLNKRGILRLSCPDLYLWATNYIHKNQRFFVDFYQKWPSFSSLSTSTDIFVGQFYGWDHKWMYDYQSLKTRLRSVGFARVSRRSFGNSRIPDIPLLEPKERRFESLYIEAQK